jgi:hypothetical protein
MFITGCIARTMFVFIEDDVHHWLQFAGFISNLKPQPHLTLCAPYIKAFN